MGSPGSGLNYVKSMPSVLKIIELVVLLIAAGTVGFYLKEGGEHDYDKKENLELFVGAVAIAGIFVIISFLTFLSGLHKKIKAINWAKAGAVVFGALAILLLVASALLADAVKYYEDKKVCKGLELVDADAQCKHLIVGLACGFIATVFFIADAIIHFRM